jgi:hypothetical protein
MESSARPERPSNTTCSFCGGAFPSRNELFRHLRGGAGTACGREVAQQGGIAYGAGKKNRKDALQARLAAMGAMGAIHAPFIPLSPTSAAAEKKEKNKKEEENGKRGKDASSKGRRKRKLGDRIARRFATSHEQELWMGDIPAAFATKKALGRLLWRSCREGEPAPIVKRVFKKGWRENKKAFKAARQVEGGCELLAAASAAAPAAASAAAPAAAPAAVSAASGAAIADPEPPASAGSSAKTDPSSFTNNKKKKRAWIGYAILAFRDASEAAEALATLNGRTIADGFVVRLRTAQAKKKAKRSKTADFSNAATAQKGKPAEELEPASVPLEPNQDPPIDAQLKPLNTDECLERLSVMQNTLDARRSNGNSSTTTKGTASHGAGSSPVHVLAPLLRSDDTDRTLRARLARVYALAPRIELQHDGKPIPTALRDRLLEALRTLKWPAKRHRTSVCADHYAVIWRGRPRDGLEELYTGCHELMTWADASFAYTHIAVTKNFVGSPHKDVLDQSHQYTTSLGDFTTGGQLCVEEPVLETQSSISQSQNQSAAPDGGNAGLGGGGGGDAGTMLHVVNTHDRIACVDGRFVHWVRGHGGGNRYSLVFYTLDPDAYTLPRRALRVVGEPAQHNDLS